MEATGSSPVESTSLVAPPEPFAYNIVMAEEKEGSGSEKYLKPSLSRKQIMVNNFLGGLTWALGSITGLTIIAIIIGFILNAVDFNLILGDWLGGIIRQSISQFEPGK